VVPSATCERDAARSLADTKPSYRARTEGERPSPFHNLSFCESWSIERFGFLNPVLINASGAIIAGHGRVEAVKLLGLTRIPTLRIEHLSDAEKRDYILADNKLAEKAGWDREILAIELQALVDMDFEIARPGPSSRPPVPVSSGLGRTGAPHGPIRPAFAPGWSSRCCCPCRTTGSRGRLGSG
jgi:hypothetical protein